MFVIHLHKLAGQARLEQQAREVAVTAAATGAGRAVASKAAVTARARVATDCL
jgi:hypothetical protein